MGRPKSSLYHLREMPRGTYQVFTDSRDINLAPIRNAARMLVQREPQYYFRTFSHEEGIERVLYVFAVAKTEERTSRELYRAARLGHLKPFKPFKPVPSDLPS